jgi:hypothetical protein
MLSPPLRNTFFITTRGMRQRMFRQSPEPVTPQEENTATGTPDDEMIQEDSGEGISYRVKKRARTSKVSYAGMDGTTAEEDANDSSILFAHQEEEFGEDYQPWIEEDGQWILEDADKVIRSVANAEEISSSYHDINERVMVLELDVSVNRPEEGPGRMISHIFMMWIIRFELPGGAYLEMIVRQRDRRLESMQCQ